MDSRQHSTRLTETVPIDEVKKRLNTEEDQKRVGRWFLRDRDKGVFTEGVRKTGRLIRFFFFFD